MRTKKPAEPKAEKTRHPMFLDRAHWIALFFFICFGFIAYETFLLAKPFMTGVLGAAMLGIIFYPWYQRIHRRVKNPSAAAALVTGGIILLTVLPLAWLVWMTLDEANNLRPTLDGFIQNYQTPAYLQKMMGPLLKYCSGFPVDLKPLLMDKASKVGAFLSSEGSKLVGHLLFMLFNGVVLMLTLFFVFRDGKKAAETILSAIPMDPEYKEVLLRGTYSTFHAVVVGIFVTATAEGLADIAGLWVAGVPLAILFGIIAAVFSLLGASVIVMVPAAIWVMNHDTGMGIFLLVWGLLISILGDNVLKNYLIGSQARMPFLLMLFSTLGGIKLYGFIGLLLGPLVVTAFMTFWTIYRRDYKMDA
jgi:predicted PurR-regulated permease PerM